MLHWCKVSCNVLSCCTHISITYISTKEDDKHSNILVGAVWHRKNHGVAVAVVVAASMVHQKIPRHLIVFN